MAQYLLTNRLDSAAPVTEKREDGWIWEVAAHLLG